METMILPSGSLSRPHMDGKLILELLAFSQWPGPSPAGFPKASSVLPFVLITVPKGITDIWLSPALSVCFSFSQPLPLSPLCSPLSSLLQLLVLSVYLPAPSCSSPFHKKTPNKSNLVAFLLQPLQSLATKTRAKPSLLAVGL